MHSHPSAFFGACAICDELRETACLYIEIRTELFEFVLCYEEAVRRLTNSCPEVRRSCVELIVCLGVWVEAVRTPV